MRKTETLVLSKHLSLESIDVDTGDRVIINTLTGQRLRMTDESMKILDAFQTPRTVASAAQCLGVSGRGSSQLHKVLSPLIEALFLVNALDAVVDEQRTLRSIINSDCFVLPTVTFAHCPAGRVTEIKEDAVVIAGIGSDQATTGHPGTRYGPERLREISAHFITYDRDIFTLANRGWYSTDFGRTILAGITFADVGNVVNHLSENPRGFYDRCFRAALSIHRRKGLPVFIGGDHSISAPLVRACREAHEDLILIHFDAHTDLAEWHPSVNHHHGNVMTRVLHENPGLEIHQFGIRGFAGVPSHNDRCHVVRQRDIETSLDGIIARQIPRGRTCYISFDVDVLDPSVAPGTGTPVPMGMMPDTAFCLLKAIASSNHVVGIDIVELCPLLDQNNMTTSLVFQLLMCLLGWVHES